MSYATSREDFFVIDKNMLRQPNAADAKAEVDAAGSVALVTDTAFVEIVRHGDWRAHYQADFEGWTDRPHRMIVAHGLGECLRMERDNGAPAPSVVDPEMTTLHQSILADLAAGNTAKVAAVAAKAASEQAALTSPGGRLDAAARLAPMTVVLDWYWRHGDEADRRTVQAELGGGVGPLVATSEIVMQGKALVGIADTLSRLGFSEATIRTLLDQPSVAASYFHAIEAFCLVLWANGNRLGPGSTNAERFLNQLLDLEYVTFALCGRGLLTREVLMQRLEAGLRQALSQRWP